MEPKPPIFRGNITELNALRAFAATMVVLDHTWPENYPLALTFRANWFLLDAFFVVSGFLIGGILLDSRARPDYYRSFYLRRGLRILPLYYVLMAALALALPFSTRSAEIMRHWGSPAWFFFFLGNIPSAIHGAWPATQYWHLWSLQIEEQFYLLFPMVVRRFEARALKRILWVLVFASPLLRTALYVWDPGNVAIQYVLLPCRMEGFALGALMAIRFREGPWELPRLRLTASTVCWVSGTLVLAFLTAGEALHPVARTIGYLVSSVASAHLVLWLIRFRGTRATAVLRTSPFQHVGTVAYGVYLLHLPIATYLAAVAHTNALNDGIPHVVAVFGVTVLCASVSWKFLESPLIQLGKRGSPQKMPSVPETVPASAEERTAARSAA